jgi:Flp pilus assembly protein TadG
VILSPTRRHAARRASGRRVGRGGEDGVVLVEIALIAPFLIALMFGIAEYSLSWRASNHAAKTLRNGVVELQRDPADRLSDYRTLDGLRQVIGTNGLDSLSWAIVYRTTSSSSGPPTACVTAANALTSGSTGVTNVCNVYSASFVLSAASSQFVTDGCASEPDRWLCPTTRRTTFASSDRIGIAVRWTHRWVTHVVPGNGTTTTDYAVGTLANDPRPS